MLQLENFKRSTTLCCNGKNLNEHSRFGNKSVKYDTKILLGIVEVPNYGKLCFKETKHKRQVILQNNSSKYYKVFIAELVEGTLELTKHLKR